MSIQIKQLAAGTSVASGGTDLYTMDEAKAAIVKSMRFVNTHATQTAALAVFLRKATTDYQISPSVNLAPGAMYVDSDEVTLLRLTGGAAQIIRATATNGTVHYVLSGIERDA
jgi:hypothetical protein